MLKKLDSFLNTLQKVESWLTICLILFLVFMNSVNLIGRALFGFSLQNVIELSRLLLVYITMLGIYGAYRNNKLIRMDIIEKRCSKRLGSYVKIFAEFVILLFLAFLIPYSMSLSWRLMDQFTPGLLVPRGFIPLGVVLGGLLLLLHNFYQILSQIQSIREKSRRVN